MTAKTRLVDAVKAIVDPVTGGIANLTSGGALYKPSTPSSPLGLLGDSRTATNNYWSATPTVCSITGTTLSVTATAIGTNAAVGHRIIASRTKASAGAAYSYPMIVATVASVVGANQITATVTYPSAGLPSGDLLTANNLVYIDSGMPRMSVGIHSWLLAFRNRAYQSVILGAYGGARMQDLISHQVPYLLSRGCGEFWIQAGINDMLASADNQSSAYVIQKYKELYKLLQGKKIVQLLESPIGGAYATTTNKTRVLELNEWLTANAKQYGVQLLDAWTPVLNSATGEIVASMTQDGVHIGQSGAYAVARYLDNHPALPPPSEWETSIADAGTALQVVANPTMSGTVGKGNVPTGYGGSLVSVTYDGGGTEYYTEATDLGNAQEFYATMTASAAGSQRLRCAYFTVTPGVKYRCTATLEVINGVNLNYVNIVLRDSASTIWAYLFQGFSGMYGIDGSYTVTGECEFVVPAGGITNPCLETQLFFAGVGTAGIKVRNFEMRAIT